jgi:SAM-dependent methyltransferase
MELCPVPTEAELQRYYNTEYSVPCSTAYYRHYEGISRELLSVIEAHAKTRGTLLEIGCSHGAFLLPARAAGWQVTGIEISAEAASNARAHGLEVVTGTLEQCGSALGTFDCIVAWYVIEHLVDVDLFLDNIKHHLKPGGLLALRTANACALVARTIPQYWQWIDAPAHVRLFSQLFLDPPKYETGRCQNSGYRFAHGCCQNRGGSQGSKHRHFDIQGEWESRRRPDAIH